MYSAHDTQIANFLTFTNFSNFEFHFVPYCSQVYIELHYDPDCVKTKKDNSCFEIHTFVNGTAVAFDTCLDKDGKPTINCPYD